MAKKAYMETPSSVKYGLSQMDRLEALENAQEEYQFPINIRRGQSFKIKVCSIDIDILKYRIENNRTNKAQAAWCRENKKEVDNINRTNWLRKQDAEDDKIQKVQHELLNEMNIEQGTIYKTFLEDDQEEPVVVNSDGFVLSGNRRLSVFRNLFYNNKRSDLKYIKVAFWDQSDNALENLYEVQQDGRKQVDLDYDWFSFGQWIAEMRHQGLTLEYIEDVSRREPSEIKKILRRYENAILFQAEQESFGRHISEKKLGTMRQVLDTYSSFNNKIKSYPPKLKRAVKRMVSPGMISWTGSGSAHLMVTYVTKYGPDKFREEFKKAKKLKDDTDIDDYFDDQENWSNICKTIGQIKTKLSSKKKAKSKINEGRDLLDSANMDLLEANAFFSVPQIGQKKDLLIDSVKLLSENLEAIKKNIEDNL
jgi:hypothetical protein